VFAVFPTSTTHAPFGPVAPYQPDWSKLLTDAAERMKLSARGYHRVLKVARTIADLAGADTIGKAHVAEALSYRRITHLP